MRKLRREPQVSTWSVGLFGGADAFAIPLDGAEEQEHQEAPKKKKHRMMSFNNQPICRRCGK